MRQTLCFDVSGDIAVIIHGKEVPSDAEWNRWLDTWYANAALYDWYCILVVSAGGAPTAAQRERMGARFRTLKPGRSGRVAVVTQSAFVRGVTNLFNSLLQEGWLISRLYRAIVKPDRFTPSYRAFSRDNLEQAVAWLSLPNERAAEILRKAVELEADLLRERP